jgi:hypothetical protein
VLGQPGDYLETVGRDLIRVVDPGYQFSETMGNVAAGFTPDRLMSQLFTDQQAFVEQAMAGRYSTVGFIHSDIDALVDYESATRLTGVPMVLLVLLGLAGPLAARRGLRLAAGLLVASAAALIVMPIVTSVYDWRYTTLGLPLLAGAAALTVDGLLARRRRAAAR